VESPRLAAETPTELLGIWCTIGQFARQQTRTAKASQTDPDTNGTGGFQKTTTIEMALHERASKNGENSTVHSLKCHVASLPGNVVPVTVQCT
jgi:hypothetical protein